MTDAQFVNAKGEKVEFSGDDPAPLDDTKDELWPNMSVANIARIGWAAHREWERIIGEQPKPEWDDLPQERRNELHDSVVWILNHSASSIAQQHNAWRAVRATGGWTDGERDMVQKTLPNMVPFDELPWSQQRKAWLWRHIVHAMVG
jgi:hypothetical protein